MPLAFEQPRFNVDAIWSAPYDNSTISSVNKLKRIWRFSLLFPFFHFSFLSFIFLFNLFVFQVCQRVVLLNLQSTKVNPKFLLFSERERESERDRASPKSSRESGGAMVLGKLSVPGRHINFR